MVTPCVGVWIEMLILSQKGTLPDVTPCVGVWIEIQKRQALRSESYVTPCVGVWIEIVQSERRKQSYLWSLPAWECGLKLVTTNGLCTSLRHSLRGSVD